MLDKFLGNRGKDLGKLLKSSVDLFGNQGILEPSIRIFVFSLFTHTFLITASLIYVYSEHTMWVIGMLAFHFLVMLPYSFFYNTRMKACQSWMTYAAITNKNTNLQEAYEITQQNKWSLRLFAFLEILFSMGTSKNESRKNTGLFALIARVVFSTFEAVFDIAEDYLLPAIVIEQKSIKESIGKLAQLKENVPATLTGAFGFDIFGQAILSFSYLINLLIFGVGLAASFALAPLVPQNLLTAIPKEIIETYNFLPHQLFIAPLIIAVGLITILYRALAITVTTLKNIYFSVFYTSINRPLDIKEQLRESLTHYLNFEDQSYVQNVKNQFSTQFGELNKGPATVQKTDTQTYEVIEKTFANNVAKGHSVESIADFLKKKGYPEQSIKEVMTKYKHSA